MGLFGKKIGILGYGNQGRAQALNLRDSGYSVLVGAREGRGYQQAVQDGFTPRSFRQVAQEVDILMFLLPDHVIPEQYGILKDCLMSGEKEVGFSHGYAIHFGGLEKFSKTGYFLVGPKGAGVILRDEFQKGKGLPGVFAVSSPRAETRQVAIEYAHGIGILKSALFETTFQEETECDLFGEQTVLCGGILDLMEAAFQTLVKKGHSPQMAFFECCYEAKRILDLWLQKGPSGLSSSISPTAFFGGITRGKRLINERTIQELEVIFDEIRSGRFSQEWELEVKNGFPVSRVRANSEKVSLLQKTYDSLKDGF